MLETRPPSLCPLVLTFHGVGRPSRLLSPGEEAYWVGLEPFLEIADELASLPDVQLTVDDGNASDVEHVLPALLERGLSATFFVLAGRIGQPGFLAYSDIVELERRDMRIGSHGFHHRAWPGLNKNCLFEEIYYARALLEGITGHQITDAACPFGRYNRAALNHLKRAGFSRIYSSDGAGVQPSGCLIPRTTVTAADSAATIRSVTHMARRRSFWGEAKAFIKRNR
jgi:peptidoglycan/xylan/chitin deacetylase (PgdA/CDA1 family)